MSDFDAQVQQLANSAAAAAASVAVAGASPNSSPIAERPDPTQNQDMSDNPEIRRLEDRIAAQELRSDLRLEAALARMDGKIDTALAKIDGTFGKIEARLDAVEKSTDGLKGTIIGTGLGVVAVVIGVLAFGQSWFGAGLTARDMVRSAVEEVLRQQPPPVKPPGAP